MEELEALFASVPLPYAILTMPYPNDPPVVGTNGPAAYCHGTCPDTFQHCLADAGWRFAIRPDIANLIVGQKMEINELTGLKIWSRVSHFDAIGKVGCKNELHFRMGELEKRAGHPMPFYPRTLYPPDEYEQLLEVWPTIPIWIVKPPALSRARMLKLSRSVCDEPPMLPYVVQEYIPRPLLITGRKFDVRLYALVTSAFPLTVYFHENGLALMATSPYDEEGDLSDLTKHITNYEINKDSPNFVPCDEGDEKIENSKWSLLFLFRYFEGLGIDTVKLRKELEEIAMIGILAGLSSARQDHRRNLKRYRRCSYEFLGIDVMLDENMKPWLLEINVSPGLTSSSGLDRRVKREVVYDTFNVIRIMDFSVEDTKNCREYVRVENVLKASLTKERIEEVKSGRVKPWDAPVFADYMIIREFVEEQRRRRGFHRVYPKRKDMDKFDYCIEEFAYEDIVLRDFVKLDNDARFAILMNNLEVVYHGLSPPPASQDGYRCDVQ